MKFPFQILIIAWLLSQLAMPSFGQTIVAAATKQAAAPSDDKPADFAADEIPIPKVSFTFDCAQWGDAGLDHILEVMKRRKITGTFFVTGKFIEVNKEGILKIAEAGYEVANHSYEHDKTNSIEECNRVAELYKEATGKTMSRYFRAPYLYEKEISWSYYAKKGWLEGYVSLITCDALPEYKRIGDALFLKNFSIYVARGAEERIAIHKTAFQRGTGHINGAAILMHIDGYRYHLLERMVDIVQRGGYQCSTFSDAFEARKLGNPFPDSKRVQEMVPLDLTGLETKSDQKDVAAVALARMVDPKPVPEKMEASRKAFADHSPSGETEIRGEVSFTFDCDYYNPVGLRSILATLEKNRAQSTFYITEKYLREFPGAVKEILEHGHEIANNGGHHQAATSATDADAFAVAFKEATGEDMIRLYRPPYPTEKIFDWHSFGGWTNGYVSLDTGDADEETKRVGDGSFVAYFKIYAAIAPKLQVPIVKVPFSGTGNLNGAVIAMHPNGFRYHLLERMIGHARDKGYNPVAQSKLTVTRL